MKTLIQGGLVYDGTGAEGQKEDVLIEHGVIEAVAPYIQAQGDMNRIDARGRIVAPGFIDIHRHCDMSPFLDEAFGDIELAQGITATIVGNCGLAPLPSVEASRRELYDYIQPIAGAIPDHLSFANHRAYADALSRTSLPIHIGFLAALGTVKTAVMGFDNAPYTKKGLENARQYVREAMEAGALGLSLGLMYRPECYSSMDELAEVVSAARPYDGVLCTHIRSEGDGLIASVDEVIEIARRAGVRLNISHFKATGVHNWHDLIFRAIDRIEEARASGLEVTADFYPYEGGATTMQSLLPKAVMRDTLSETLAFLATPLGRERLKAALEKRYDGWDNMPLLIGWERVIASSLSAVENTAYAGMSIAEIAKRWGCDPSDALARLLITEKGRAGVVVMSMAMDDVAAVARLPWTALISDALYGGGESPHPRLYGSFPKFLREFVAERKVVSMARAIHKMSGLPARRMGLKRYGTIAASNRADVTIFDPAAFTDHASYLKPKQRATGMEWVLIGGEAAWRNEGREANALGHKLSKEI